MHYYIKFIFLLILLFLTSLSEADISRPVPAPPQSADEEASGESPAPPQEPADSAVTAGPGDLPGVTEQPVDSAVAAGPGDLPAVAEPVSGPVPDEPVSPSQRTARVRAYDDDAFFSYLQKLYEKRDKNVRELSIREMSHYLELFEESGNAPEVLYMLARTHDAGKDEDHAMAAFLRLVFRYPRSERRGESLVFVKKLVETDRSYAAKRGWLLDYLEQDVSGKTTADRMYMYLNVLTELQQPKLRQYSIESCYGFIEDFPQDSRVAEVVQWIGDYYAGGKDYEEAVAVYDKYAQLYPDYDSLRDILYQKGILQFKELNDYGAAVKTFDRVVRDYPESSIAANALFTSGELKEKRLKDYPAAIEDYRKLVTDYPTNVRAVEGLWAMADLYASKLQEYESAIETYNRIVEDYPTDPQGAKALEDIAAIYRKRLKDYAAAADNLAKISERYPDYAKAPDRLYDAGVLVEKELKEYNLAISYYEMVIEKYGSDKRARDAGKRIDRIRDTIGFDEEPMDYEMETDSPDSRE
jgi:TolA-binding protein